MHRPKVKSNAFPPKATAREAVRSEFSVWLFAALLVLMTITVYWPATRCDFINLDDPGYVTENPHVQGGLTPAGVIWAFQNTEQAASWAPLMWLSHMLACQWFGLNAWGHHLINVLLHAANTALVFLVFRRMTGAVWRSLMLAALFGLHPLRVESVAWVAERKDVLSTLFWLLTLWAYVRYVEAVQSRPSKPDIWYGTALLMFGLGLMSKAMLVTLPCVLLLLDYWPLERFKHTSRRRRLTEKIPFFALATAASVVTFVAQQRGGAVVAAAGLPVGARVGNALISYCRYLGKIFWPTDLAAFYPHPGYWPMQQVLLAGMLIVGISALFFVMRRRYPFLLVGWLWYCGTLVPVIGLVQSGEQAMADRFTYVPALGVMLQVSWGALELTRRWRSRAIALSVAGSVAIVICIGLTRQQLGYWRDSETLWRHALEVTKGNYFAHRTLGDALVKKNEMDDAISQYEEAIRLQPGDASAHDGLGTALAVKGQTDDAVNQFKEAIRLQPDYTDPHYNLGVELVTKGQIDQAIIQYQEVVRLKPDDVEARNNLGNALGLNGQIDGAIIQYREAIRLKPDAAVTYNNLGTALGRKGRIDEAITEFQEALRLNPDYAEAHNSLGIAFYKKGQVDEAARQFQEAIRLKPDYAEARRNLRNILGQ